MKKLLLFLTLVCLVLSFNACSSDDDEQKPSSNSLRSCTLWVVKDKDYNSIMYIESGSYDRSTQTLNLKAKDGQTLTFVLKLEEGSNRIQSLTYNSTLYIMEHTTYYFYYYESDAEYVSTDFPHYGINAEVQTTVYSNEGTLTFNGNISFYQ